MEVFSISLIQHNVGERDKTNIDLTNCTKQQTSNVAFTSDKHSHNSVAGICDIMGS
jgi:hypothetical protein